MELKEFIKETLLQIVLGVKEAQTESVQHGAIINPAEIKSSESTVFALIENNERSVQLVSFEVALASSSGESIKGGIGVMLASIGAGVNKSSDDKNSLTTGIKFSVPVALPAVANNNSSSLSPTVSFGSTPNKHRY